MAPGRCIVDLPEVAASLAKVCAAMLDAGAESTRRQFRVLFGDVRTVRLVVNRQDIREKISLMSEDTRPCSMLC